jgi:two-component system, NtrC family, sensor histidine kinase AtoS
MSSIKKNEKKSSVHKTGNLEYKLNSFSKLELAYAQLSKEFDELKAKLKNSHQTLEQVIAHMSEGLMFVAGPGVISLFNPAAAELLGFSSLECLLDCLYWHHFPDAFFGFSMKEALQKTACHQRIFLTLDDEKEIEISTSTIPERGVLLLLRNRSEERQLEKGLDHSERLKELGEMAATLAHEIRNPLGGIKGFAELLKRELVEPAHQRMIASILEGTHALNGLVTQVLDYARPLCLHFEETDLTAFIQETLEFASASLQLPSLHFISSHTVYPKMIDRAQMKHVLLNLLKNAFEAKASRVEIDLKQEGALVIKDNGEGMSKKILKKIFTPFFTTKARGTGLGLSFSLAVIKAHGATLEVLSEEGRGTEIIIKF